ncbi:SNAP25-associated protein [Ranunculus cassubicifolius]
MFGFRKSPNTKVVKQNSVDATANPFDSDSESDTKKPMNPARRTSSEPVLQNMNNGYSDDEGRGTSSYASRNKYKNGFRDSGGLENQSVQELEGYAAYKAEEVTDAVKNCLKIAEDIRDDASNTLVTLHNQGEQITRTHNTAANIDQDLSRGEKLLGSLGGMFSKTWKPKKTRAITGPVITSDEAFKKKQNHTEQREKLGIAPAPRGGKSNSRQPSAEPTTALQKVEAEKAKQDDGLDDISNILGDLKNMAVDMGSELERQNKALEHLDNDIDELNNRVKGANQRTRRLLGK